MAYTESYEGDEKAPKILDGWSDGKSSLTGQGEGCPDGTHPSVYGEKDGKHIIENKAKQPGE